MGVNAQKRKKKQGPVPTLEESLPKKFKSDQPAKPKRTGNGVEKKPNAQKPVKKVGERRKDADDDDDANGFNENEERVFGTTKSSLFNDSEDEPEDEFDGLSTEFDLYASCFLIL